ncbi:MAG: hypothetical protein H0U87_12165 [Acidobacteria bacterium]|nr:hypothetical protein [Acidobacteriota bacterium]
MEAIVTETFFNSTETSLPSRVEEERAAVFFAPPEKTDELCFELDLWLSGLHSFLTAHSRAFGGEENRSERAAVAATRDWTREFRLTRLTLLLCSSLTFRLEKSVKIQNDFERGGGAMNSIENPNPNLSQSLINRRELHQLSRILKGAILLNESITRGGASLGVADWTAWSAPLAVRLKNCAAAYALESTSEACAEEFLPAAFRRLLERGDGKPLSSAMRADLNSILPRFAKILKSLSVVERMLDDDEPLKPSLLIFALVHEQIQELIKYANNRLLRFPEEQETALSAALDATAYTAAIELRKVYNHELSGVSELRAAPSVFAHIETAFSLLNESFQQTLVGFAQLIDPQIEPLELFPNFQSKLRQSLVLRQTLHDILQTVQSVEQNPEKEALQQLHQHLREFSEGTIHFLFYKDKETVERFVEEILASDDKKDLVPILHRFGAYLETLFGQVNMRSVLAKHPFEK